jgi:selenocysteine lyase/cysteine desulfurase
MGPEGCAILYVQQDVQDTIEPVEFGWTNVANFGDYSSRDMTLRSDAGRYEPGTLNTIGVYGLRAALEFILSIGVDQIAPAVQALADQVAFGAQAKGYSLLTPRIPETSAGIVSIRKEGVDCRVLYSNLKKKGFLTAPRDGWLRISPHFYLTSSDIDLFLSELP